MKIVPFDAASRSSDNGKIGFRHMLQSDPASPENFMLILGRQEVEK
jgi:hypothetical protein